MTYGLVSDIGEIAVRLLLFPSNHSERPQLGGKRSSKMSDLYDSFWAGCGLSAIRCWAVESRRSANAPIQDENPQIISL